MMRYPYLKNGILGSADGYLGQVYMQTSTGARRSLSADIGEV